MNGSTLPDRVDKLEVVVSQTREAVSQNTQRIAVNEKSHEGFRLLMDERHEYTQQALEHNKKLMSKILYSILTVGGMLATGIGVIIKLVAK